MSEHEEAVSLYDPARATAQYVRSIALLIFAGLLGGVAAGLGASRSTGWAAAVVGIAALVVVIRAIWMYLDGNMFLKR